MGNRGHLQTFKFDPQCTNKGELAVFGYHITIMLSHWCKTESPLAHMCNTEVNLQAVNKNWTHSYLIINATAEVTECPKHCFVQNNFFYDQVNERLLYPC